MGESKYNNYTEFLENNGYRVLYSLQQFIDTQKISYECKNGHVSTLTQTAFGNKKCTKLAHKLCSKCAKASTSNDDFDLKKNTIFSLNGHVITEINGRNVTYKCGNCDEIRTSTFGNLKKSSKYCGACISSTTKKTMDDIVQEFEQLKIDNGIPHHYKILNYENNKNVTFKCLNHDHTFKTSYADLKRGRRCPECSGSRRAETNLQRYGVVNPFESEQVKQKIKETCLEKYGETHHMKVEKIRKKAEQTNLNKIGVKYAFHTPESFEKIRKTCIKRYGAEFPLQSAFIQAKITQRWLEKIGARRPMIDQDYWKKQMLDKYGVDHYSKTDQFKVDYVNTCLAKYGVDHYFKSEQYSSLCLAKYGVDHPMKNKKIFAKALKNHFSRKPFTYPSGRVDYILGYEGIAIKELLEEYNEKDIITSVWCIPTFKYNRVSSEVRPMLGDAESKMSVYYPDILLPDKIIEVKNEYLYKRDKVNVVEKMKAVVRSGYKGELWVYRNEKKLLFKKSFVMVEEEIVVTKFK